jgi:hypothetical protein
MKPIFTWRSVQSEYRLDYSEESIQMAESEMRARSIISKHHRKSINEAILFWEKNKYLMSEDMVINISNMINTYNVELDGSFSTGLTERYLYIANELHRWGLNRNDLINFSEDKDGFYKFTNRNPLYKDILWRSQFEHFKSLRARVINAMINMNITDEDEHLKAYKAINIMLNRRRYPDKYKKKKKK